MKSIVSYYLMLTYIAPDHATDAKGNPVLTYNRPIQLDKGSYKSALEQMENGKTEIFLNGRIKLKDGHEEKKIEYVNLNNTMLIRAYTIITERLEEKEVEKVKERGKTVLYDPEGKPILVN